MNFNAMIDTILAKTGRWGDTTLRALVLGELVSVQAQLEQAPELPWFLFREQTLSVSSAATALPTGFIRFEEDSCFVNYTNSEGALVWPAPLQLSDFRDYAAASASQSYPQAYAITSTQILVAPVPESEIILTFHAAFSDVAPTDAAVTNLWATHASDVLVYNTGSRVASDILQDAELSSTLDQRAKVAWDVLKRHSLARKIAHLNFAKGDD